jgi:hypothetical protein
MWTLTSHENNAALRLQEKCGFRPTSSAYPEAELEVDLPVARPIALNRAIVEQQGLVHRKSG